MRQIAAGTRQIATWALVVALGALGFVGGAASIAEACASHAELTSADCCAPQPHCSACDVPATPAAHCAVTQARCDATAEQPIPAPAGARAKLPVPEKFGPCAFRAALVAHVPYVAACSTALDADWRASPVSRLRLLTLLLI